MRVPMVLLPIFLSSAAHGFDQIRWPDPEVAVPPLVQSFISAECLSAKGTSEETVDECIQAERYGYRAVVTMLSEEDTAQRAIERYRICSGGLGSLGGKFHRRKAVCIGKPLRYAWQFEFMQKAARQQDIRIVRAQTPDAAAHPRLGKLAPVKDHKLTTR